ncbi:protein of unknown function [Xenorhabdus nematophila AN6/1]|nr:hypothetical protein XNA1_200017 [Xenorhabdus nematophila str. Anatoliense]CEE92917.1 hypothetical protein XNA1_3180018 [Xenorhabdus nematophila str. Anatoliense]CEF29775.1 hypothetical protein XNW1_2000016 [Xenorhabdus nematophila str. Websteri]CEF29912.1 hypothetical protein XNW1_210017 [Xenorhabdus nematophila str. Websteri]CEK21629.1 protein of unknown function [Xenorhabdus nematophila AN6/1]
MIQSPFLEGSELQFWNVIYSDWFYWLIELKKIMLFTLGDLIIFKMSIFIKIAVQF